jgi:hypothetical protein
MVYKELPVPVRREQTVLKEQMEHKELLVVRALPVIKVFKVFPEDKEEQELKDPPVFKVYKDGKDPRYTRNCRNWYTGCYWYRISRFARDSRCTRISWKSRNSRKFSKNYRVNINIGVNIRCRSESTKRRRHNHN